MPGSVQSVGHLFGQTPESLVEPDLAVDAAQGTQGAKPSKPVSSAVGEAAAHEVFLNAIERCPQVATLVLRAAQREQSASVNWRLLQGVIAKQECVPGELQRFALAQLTITEAVDEGTKLGHVFENTEARRHNLLGFHVGVPETDRFEFLVGDDQAIAAQAAKYA